MSPVQIFLIALFIYLGSIGSIVGNTIGWYTLGRPLVAAFVVGLIMGDVPTAMAIGIALALGKGMGTTEIIGLAVVFAGIGGLVGQLMWNLSYALNLPLNRIANKYAEAGETGKMYVPNVVCGQLIGFACRFIPAVIVLTSLTLASGQGDFASIIPGWVTTLLSVFGGMMAALGMGIILSFLLKKQYHIVIFLAGFILVTYFGLSTMAVAVVSVITAVLYFVAYDKVKVEA